MDAPQNVFETRDGSLWAAGSHENVGVTARFFNGRWLFQTHPRLTGSIHLIYEASDRALWFGGGGPDSKRGQLGGLLQFDPSSAPDGWTPHILPPELSPITTRGLHLSLDGALWLSYRRGGVDGVRRYRPEAVPPKTEITLSPVEVSQPGNTTLAWTGRDAWRATPDEQIQYAYRLNGGQWSSFSTAKNRLFETLPDGDYLFEVKARDSDFNKDPTPASVTFTVIPPVWKQPWFIALVVSFVGITTFQASRIVIRDRKLQEANHSLSSANKELFRANLEIQEQSERKSAFLASMSHELRTPMNAIKGFTNLVLRRQRDLSEQNRENLEKVTQASDHLLAMINDLLDLSKIEGGRMDVNVSNFDVRKPVMLCVSTVSPLVQEGVDLSYEVDEEVGEAHTDEARLRQMLINLASNAIKFTPSGRVVVKARQEADQLVFSVSDTGKGIPEDELATIFDEYRQVEGSDREHKGTGLGLSITKQFAELLGGSIGVESEVGKGSTFTVRVPVVYEEEE